MPDVTESYGTPFDFIAFFRHFHCCISTKLSQIVLLIDVHTLVYQHVKCDGRFSDLIMIFFGIFIYYYVFKSL